MYIHAFFHYSNAVASVSSQLDPEKWLKDDWEALSILLGTPQFETPISCGISDQTTRQTDFQL